MPETELLSRFPCGGRDMAEKLSGWPFFLGALLFCFVPLAVMAQQVGEQEDHTGQVQLEVFGKIVNSHHGVSQMLPFNY